MKKFILKFFSLSLFISLSLRAGFFDEVEVKEINPSANCLNCLTCPANEGVTGKCGEKYILSLFRNHGLEAYEAQHNNSGHGIDIIGFDCINNIVLLHESKYSGKSGTVTPAKFKSLLGSTISGEQCSLNWFNDALLKMQNSSAHEIPELANLVNTKLGEDFTFLRLGNLRSDKKNTSKIQIYRINDAQNSKGEGISLGTTFISGPFLKEYNYNGPKIKKLAVESDIISEDILKCYIN